MREFELYMNKKINLPKSVLITIDDGWLRQKAVEVLDKNEMHATIFLITSSSSFSIGIIGNDLKLFYTFIFVPQIWIMYIYAVYCFS